MTLSSSDDRSSRKVLIRVKSKGSAKEKVRSRSLQPDRSSSSKMDHRSNTEEEIFHSGYDDDADDDDTSTSELNRMDDGKQHNPKNYGELEERNHFRKFSSSEEEYKLNLSKPSTASSIKSRTFLKKNTNLVPIKVKRTKSRSPTEQSATGEAQARNDRQLSHRGRSFGEREQPLPRKSHSVFSTNENVNEVFRQKKVIKRRPASRFSDLAPTFDYNRLKIVETDGQNSESSKEISENSRASSQSTMIETRPKIMEDIGNCAWKDLHNHLQILSERPEMVLEELCSVDSNGSNVMHLAAWKCPPQLATLIYDLLTEQEYCYFKNVDKDGNTPVHLCSANLCMISGDGTSAGNPYVDLSALEFLLERVPESLGIQNLEGDTPLHLFLASSLASQSNRGIESADGYSLKVLNLVADLMPDKSCFLLQDVTGATPLHNAIANNASEAIILRLIEIAPDACKMEDEVGLTPLHYVAAFRTSLLSIAQRIVQEYQYAICHKTKNGDTPLHTMIGNSADVFWDSSRNRSNKDSSFTEDDVALMELLLGDSEHKDLNEEYCPSLLQNREKLTPLHCFALFNAPLKIGNILLAHPSSSKTRLMKNSFGSTPLHLAAAHPDISLQTMKILSSLEHSSALDVMRRTPLHIAAQNTNISAEVIKCLIQSNPLACNKESDGGYLPLHMAMHCLAKVEVVQELVDAYPSALERESILGDTPLHKAATNNAPADVIRFLLHKFPNVIYTQNNMGDLPLHCCAAAGDTSVEAIRTLLEAWPQGASLQNRAGNCPLHFLVKHRNENEIDAIDLLTNEGSMSVNLLNNEGKSPIDIAKECGASNEVISILETAADQWRKSTLEEDWGKFESFEM